VACSRSHLCSRDRLRRVEIRRDIWTCVPLSAQRLATWRDGRDASQSTHNPEVAGSNPGPATNEGPDNRSGPSLRYMGSDLQVCTWSTIRSPIAWASGRSMPGDRWGVDLHRDRRVRVPDSFAEDLHVVSGVLCHRRVGVSHVVQPDPWNTGTVHESVEPSGDGVGMERSALWSNHYVVVLGVAAVECVTFVVDAFDIPA
jgi:hypothetical protein